MQREKKRLSVSKELWQYEIENPDTGDFEHFVMKPASGADSTSFRNMIMNNATLGASGRPEHVQNLADAETFLVSRCLFVDLEPDGKGKPGTNVSIAKISKWDAPTTKDLYQDCREISKMSEASKERDLLLEMMNTPGSPINFQLVRAWIKRQEDKTKWRALLLLFEEETESVKN